jgi:hypothetical protein
MRTIKLLVCLLALTGTAMAQCPPSVATTTVDFKWSPSAGTGNELLRPAAHGNISTSYAVNGYTVFVNVKDPNNRLAINNYTSDPLINTHPPYSFTYTQTNGSVGNPAGQQANYNNYLQLGMFSANNTEKVEVEYIFSTPVYLCNLEISDIDYDGSGASTPGTNYISYQDEVDVVAVNGSTNVPVTITPAAAFTDVTITGQNVVANFVSEGFGDVSAASNFGKVFLNTSSPITKITISYSNGPLDDGASNDHHIRIGGALGVATTTTLPAKIISFNGTRVDNTNYAAQLVVANQQNVDRYEFQRSTDGVNFTTVATRTATSATTYYFTDNTASTGVTFYRVKVVDKNGPFVYSFVIMDEMSIRHSYIVFQQGGGFALQAKSESAKRINVKVLNAAGAMVASQDYQLTKGTTVFNLPAASTRQPGLYFVAVVENGRQVYSAKIMK